MIYSIGFIFTFFDLNIKKLKVTATNSNFTENLLYHCTDNANGWDQFR